MIDILEKWRENESQNESLHTWLLINGEKNDDLERNEPNKFCQFLFSCLHPRIGLSLAQYFSNKSRIHTGTKDDNYEGKESEWLYQFSKEKLTSTQFDYFIFGHRHLPMDIQISKSRYINLGEWMNYATFATYDGENLSLKVWRDGEIEEFKGIQES